MQKKYSWILLAVLLMPLWVVALPSDKNKPMLIQADEANINHKTGVSIYKGHVRVDQGTMHLLSHRLEVHTNKQNKVARVIATGDMAYFQVLPHKGKPIAHAKARKIELLSLERVIYFEGDATVWQGGDVFKGPIIHYDINKQVVITPPSKGGRTVILLQPKKKSKSTNQVSSSIEEKTQ